MGWILIACIILCNAIMWAAIYQDRNKIYPQKTDYAILVIGGIVATIFGFGAGTLTFMLYV